MKKTGTFFLSRDNFSLGLVLGVLTPILIFFLIYYSRFSGYYLDEYIRTFFHENRMITFYGVWALVGNIALLTVFINTRKDRTAKGVFVVTLVFGIAVLLVKLFN